MEKRCAKLITTAVVIFIIILASLGVFWFLFHDRGYPSLPYAFCDQINSTAEGKLFCYSWVTLQYRTEKETQAFFRLDKVYIEMYKNDSIIYRESLDSIISNQSDRIIFTDMDSSNSLSIGDTLFISREYLNSNTEIYTTVQRDTFIIWSHKFGEG